MGFMVDGLACFALNSDENGTSSENKSLSRNACSLKKKLNGKKSDENAKEKCLIV